MTTTMLFVEKNATEATLETIAAMRQQEERGYAVAECSCLEDSSQQCVTSSHPLHVVNLSTAFVTDESRIIMTAWCYQVVDFCNIRRDVVEVAMSYLDRYMATPVGRHTHHDRQRYQLAAMTCLYTAVKVHEPRAMDLQMVSRLSRGVYSPEDIQEMERSILFAIHWRLNPPTALAFVHQFLQLLPNSFLSNEAMLQTVYNLAKYQAELAVARSELIPVPASMIALGCIANACSSLGHECSFRAMRHITTALSGCRDKHKRAQRITELGQVQQMLLEAVLQQPSDQTNGYGALLLMVHRQQEQQSAIPCASDGGMHVGATLKHCNMLFSPRAIANMPHTMYRAMVQVLGSAVDERTAEG